MDLYPPDEISRAVQVLAGELHRGAGSEWSTSAVVGDVSYEVVVRLAKRERDKPRRDHITPELEDRPAYPVE